MPRNRCPKPGSKYYVPKQKFKTVVAFCLSYDELKAELKDLDGRHSKKQDGMPRGSETSDPTSKEAEARIKVENKIKLIEETVMECSGHVLYPFMMMAVTKEEIGWAWLEANQIPVHRTTYIELRRKIYFEMSKRI